MDQAIDPTLSHVLDPLLEELGSENENDLPQHADLDASALDSTAEAGSGNLTGLDASGQEPETADLSASTAVSAAPGTSTETPDRKTGRRGRKKGPGIVPGSEADLKRREANRLAAERSRWRQQEKSVALEMALQALGAENLRLQAEIAKLEGRDAEGAKDVTGEGEVASGSGSVSQAGDAGLVKDAQGQVAESEAREAIDTSVSDAQSHTILAALMSDAGMDGLSDAFGADSSSWVAGVASLFKEAEASGRLSELAAIAAHQGDGPEGATSGPDAAAVGTSQGAGSVGSNAGVVGSGLGLSAGAVKIAAASASAFAVALNAEMVKAITDDLAATHAAIARVERDTARLRGDAVDSEEPVESVEHVEGGEGMTESQLASMTTAVAVAAAAAAAELNGFDNDSGTGSDLRLDESGLDMSNHSRPYVSPLPAAVLSTSEADLAATIASTQTSIAQLEVEAKVLREVVGRMRTVKAEEEGQVAEMVEELRALGMDGGEGEREKVGVVLRATRNYISGLLAGLAVNPLTATQPTSFTSPSTAFRRRGRPPKALPTIKNTYALLYNSSNGGGSSSGGTDGTPTRSGRRARGAMGKSSAGGAGPSGGDVVTPGPKSRARGRKSRLAQEVRLSPDSNEEGGQDTEHGEGVDAVAAMNGHLEGHGGHEELLDPDHDLDEHEHDHEHEQQHSAAAEFLLSHITDQGEQPLDAGAFADLLPITSADIESAVAAVASRSMAAAAVGGQGDDVHSAGSGDVVGVVNGGGDGQAQAQGSGQGVGVGVGETPLTPAFAKIRRGPPGTCDICGRTETSVWRKLNVRGDDYKVCNACGLYHTKFGIIRPPELWGDGKSVKKRKSVPRPSNASAAGGSESTPKRKRKGKAGEGDVSGLGLGGGVGIGVTSAGENGNGDGGVDGIHAQGVQGNGQALHADNQADGQDHVHPHADAHADAQALDEMRIDMDMVMQGADDGVHDMADVNRVVENMFAQGV